MCAPCGCSEEGAVRVHHHEHASGHDHTHEHAHTPAHAHGDTVRLEEAVLGRNAGLAEKNRAWFRERGILALNVVSSPGAGKTTLLVRTIRKSGDRLPISVIEG